jgi:predicted transcriptional regulator
LEGVKMTERISDAEHTVMEVLWDTSPLSAQEVAERVPVERGWSANTVKTLLGRLLAKNVIAHKEEGRRYLYRPLVERADYVAGESRRLMDRLFGGRLTPLVAHLAERDEITEQDIAEIEALLRDLKS